MKRIAILGITGSIGRTALQALKPYKDTLEIVSASVNTSISDGFRLCSEHRIDTLCVTSRTKPTDFYGIKIYNSIPELLESERPDIVLNGIAGSPGLEASIAVVNSGAKLALANKETIVLGGSAFLDFVQSKNGTVIPVDSEHSAIDELLSVHGKNTVSKLIITASGGPFLRKTRSELSGITPEEAANHPTWRMGQKISIDSATLANKGLEVIEAHYLFDFPAKNIDVVVHPESIVHSMVQTISGQVYAQMSCPDMAGPIMRALLERNFTREVSTPPPFFESLNLHFEKPDFKRFPLLGMAFHCAETEGYGPIVYNIADELAVEKFVKREIRFTDIDIFVENALSRSWERPPAGISEMPKYLEYVRRTLGR